MTSPQSQQQNNQQSEKRILIVDDNKVAADALAKLLKYLGYNISVAYDGLSGIDSFIDYGPDFVFLDISMPDLDGHEVARRIRSIEKEDKRVILVALTGYGRDKDILESKEAGFNYHLVKPVDVKLLERIINLPVDELPK